MRRSRWLPSVMLLFLSGLHATPPPGRWQMTFDEECGDTTIDAGKWIVDKTIHGTPGLLSTRQPENLVIENGICHFVVKEQERLKGFPWTTAGIITKTFHQEFGYFEVRMRYGAASGLNNAFWLDAATPNPVHFEIDINEGHYPSQVNVTVHDWAAGNIMHQARLAVPGKLSDAFHIYGLLWTPDLLIWFMDGKEIHREPATDVRGQMRVLLTTAVLPWAGAVVGSGLDGSSMDVDWVRIYCQEESKSGPVE
jgi:beta-glucanase (GH16 family)